MAAYRYRVLQAVPPRVSQPDASGDRDIDPPTFLDRGIFEANRPQDAALAAAQKYGTPAEDGGDFLVITDRHSYEVPVDRSTDPRYSIAEQVSAAEPLASMATVVVNGHSVEVELDDGRDLIADALEAAGVAVDPNTDWELRDEGGSILVADASGVGVGETVFLNPAVGGGAGGGETP
jgi:hypothetical protein